MACPNCKETKISEQELNRVPKVVKLHVLSTHGSIETEVPDGVEVTLQEYCGSCGHVYGTKTIHRRQ